MPPASAPPGIPPPVCQTGAPAPGWFCVSGGWVPPGHPLAPGAPIPPTVPPAGPGPLPVQPELLMVDSSHVAQVAASLRRGEPTFQPALTALVADANRALKLAPVSVMDKGITPPSGDKHDYMSQAPYWWPDPSKPGGRPYIRRDGERN